MYFRGSGPIGKLRSPPLPPTSPRFPPLLLLVSYHDNFSCASLSPLPLRPSRFPHPLRSGWMVLVGAVCPEPRNEIRVTRAARAAARPAGSHLLAGCTAVRAPLSATRAECKRWTRAFPARCTAGRGESRRTARAMLLPQQPAGRQEVVSPAPNEMNSVRMSTAPRLDSASRSQRRTACCDTLAAQMAVQPALKSSILRPLLSPLCPQLHSPPQSPLHIPLHSSM